MLQARAAQFNWALTLRCVVYAVFTICMQVKKSIKVVVVQEEVAVKKSLKNPTDIEMSQLHKCTALKYTNVRDLEHRLVHKRLCL